MEYTRISATVIRQDGKVHEQKDLDDFSQFWKDTYNPGKYNGGMPDLFTTQKEIWADFDGYFRFEASDLFDFAQSHPHLIIKITERTEEDGGTETDHLYHGCLYESLDEIRYMPQPTTISWPRSYSHNNTFLNNKTFLEVFGEMVMLSLEDMMQNTTNEDLGKYIFESLGWQEGNEHLMFSAIVGWDIGELIRRTNEALEERKDE